MPRGKRNNYNYYYPQRSKVVGKRNKYSTMTYYCTNLHSPAQVSKYFIIVPPTDVGGMRKVKNITIQLAFDKEFEDRSTNPPTIGVTEDNRLLWAIVYVPRGSDPGSIRIENGIFYTPPQFIMASGIYDTDQPGNSSRVFTPLSRNLNSGDGIAFVYLPMKELYASQISAVINYAITLQ